MVKHVIFAPGRVEILGNHTDYNGGSVISAAIPYGIKASGSRRADDEIILRTGFLDHPLACRSFVGDDFMRRSDWSDYPLGVVEMLKVKGLVKGGFEISFTSGLPAGAGLSSSAALEVSTALLLARLFEFSLSGMEFAELCKEAENLYVGVPCGILDQVSSLFGKKNHAIHLDCRTNTVDTISFPDEVTLLVIQSGETHSLASGEYEERRRQCASAAKLLGVPYLCDAPPSLVASSKLLDPERRRVSHVINENQRVLLFMEMLACGNPQELGRLMTASHESSRLDFENSTPLLDLLVSISVSTPGVLGARLTGGGFGGSVVALVARDHAAIAGELIVREYSRRSGKKVSFLACDLADGALEYNGINPTEG